MIREAQADGAYAEALVRCERAAAALMDIRDLSVAGPLADAVAALAEDTAAQLSSAVQAVCSDFSGPAFLRASTVTFSWPHVHVLGQFSDRTMIRSILQRTIV